MLLFWFIYLYVLYGKWVSPLRIDKASLLWRHRTVGNTDSHLSLAARLPGINWNTHFIPLHPCHRNGTVWWNNTLTVRACACTSEWSPLMKNVNISLTEHSEFLKWTCTVCKHKESNTTTQLFSCGPSGCFSLGSFSSWMKLSWFCCVLSVSFPCVH